MRLTLSFDEVAATRREQAGGKGANLALLTQRGFAVPAGFVVPAAAYREFVASAAGLARRVAALPFGEAAALREACNALRMDLARLSFPPALAAEIRERLAAWPEAQACAVRSSSTLEDLASAAFAGQHDTFLNCIGAEQVLARVKDCWLSLWMDRAVAYRHQQRFDHQHAAMAVVVQQMVACEAAGVGFSVNPVSGELGELVVDANFGLGESVVSGEAEVDHWVLDKATLVVREARIAQKTHCVVGAGPNGGTEEQHVDAFDAAQPALNEAQLREVGALLVRVEQSWAFPQDIEWGIAEGRVWLLQARPITTIPPRWTRDESAERFPNVISPLTWDFVEEGFHRSLNHSLRLMGFPAFNGKWFGLHGHYVYGNQNAVELYARRAPFAPPRSLDEVRALIPTLRENFAWVQELPVAWHRDLDFYLLKIGEFMAEPLAKKTPREVWGFVLRVNAHGANYFLPNIAISISHGLLYRFLHGILQLAVGPAAAAGLFDGLLAHCETKTGIINKELFELAQLARAQPGLEPALSARGSRALVAEGALAAWPVFQARFEKFLRDHGHREIEFDAYAPTWVEAPWVVLDNLRLILKGSLEAAPAMRERELKVRQQQAELELYRTLPADMHFFFGEILRLTRLYTSLDDLEHYQTTRLTLPLRRGLRELGTRLVARGVLAEPMDIFFAHQAQIAAVFQADTDASWRELATQVRGQKRAYLEAKKRSPAWILDAATEAAAHHATGLNGTKTDYLTGIAGSAGVAEGPVYVVQSSDDFAAFPKNAVLVARTTNPTWTPLFYNAAAVVTESGGPLSHGAVTAREMRIPAVMAVKGSLARLRNGQRVRVDGGAGKVMLLEG
jgi:pyruvate,water dikinase